MSYSDQFATWYQGIDTGLTYQQKQKAMRAGFYAVLLITLVLFVFPMYWMINSALKVTEMVIAPQPTYLPWSFTLEHFIDIFANRNYERWYLNSILVAIITIALTVVTATLAGYGLTRIKFRGRKNFARAILFSYMFPPILLAFPQYQIWQQIGLLNSYIGITIAHTAIALPFSMWAMWKFFQTVPLAYEESVWMNGGTRFHSFKDVVIPMAKPGMVAVAIFTFAVSWNDFTMSTILLPDTSMQTLPPATMTFQQGNYVFWGEVMAAVTLISIPPFILVYTLQKSILEGFRTGGM